MSNEKDVVDVFDKWLTSRLENIHTCIPGKIEKYYGHGSRTVKVQPLLKMKNQFGVVIDMPPIDNVPIIFPGGSKISMVWKPEKNDGVLIIFSETDLYNFVNGDGETASDPKTSNRFKLSDAICIPGLWSSNNLPDAPDNEDDFFLTYDDCSIQMDGTTTIINGNFEVDA